MEESLETGNWKDPEETLNYRWGGIAALLLAIGYLAIIPLFVRVGAPPTTGEEWFHYLPGKTMEWWLIIWLSVITDLLYPPVAWALWIALSKVGRKRMLASVFCLNLFVVLDLAVTWTHHASLLALFQSYSSAADDARRAACVAAADYAASIYATPLLSFYILVIPSLGLRLGRRISKYLRLQHFVVSRNPAEPCESAKNICCNKYLPSRVQPVCQQLEATAPGAMLAHCFPFPAAVLPERPNKSNDRGTL
jgi:hypothetical protein